jgi:hypothetical protein
MFEFLSAKLWFWFACCWAWILLFVFGLYLSLKFELKTWIETLLIGVPFYGLALTVVVFAVSVLARAWGA